VEKFTVHTGRVAPLRRSDVDTDQIIPAVWLKQVSRTGFGAGLFSAWREADRDFVLNRPEYAGVSVLVAGPDFGTGSSREHAVWALQDFGFRVVLAPRFGDIFRGNSLKAGLLTVVVAEELVEQLWARAEADPRSELTVDLQARELRFDDRTVPFELDDFSRRRLLDGLDDIGLTLRHTDAVDAYEARRPAFLPATLPVA
jgi:3-isopropylmalate/(R)-2-methylmalate dehydratase small subunit